MGVRSVRPPVADPRPGGAGRPARAAALALLAGLLAACGATSATASPTRQQAEHTTSAIPTPTPAIAPTAYCDAQDTPIPGAAAALANGQLNLSNPTAVEQAWWEMGATMVPACSEITSDPPAIQTKNLTNGQLSDAAFTAWLIADNQTWTLIEWAQQHDQARVIQLLDWGPAVVEFVSDGGKIADDKTCEYPEKVYAVSVTAGQMSDLNSGGSSSPGVVYVQAAVGPCTSLWTSADGSVANKDVGEGQESVELDLTVLTESPALGPYVTFAGSYDQGWAPTVDGIISASGI